MNPLNLLIFFILLSFQVFTHGSENPLEHVQEHPDQLTNSLQALAYDWLGALSNLGFCIRDERYIGSIEPSRKKFLSTYLFSGNKYWFCIAINPGKSKIKIIITDEGGNREQTTEYTADSIYAVGIEPKTSGRYSIMMEVADGDRTEFCLLYAYRKK